MAVQSSDDDLCCTDEKGRSSVLEELGIDYPLRLFRLPPNEHVRPMLLILICVTIELHTVKITLWSSIGREVIAFALAA